jgi:hypothetical protein
MNDPAPVPATPAPGPKPENMLLNLACNVAAPALVLFYLSQPARLGPLWGLLVALAFPLGYGIYDLVIRRKWNFLSGFGLFSVMVTGGLGLLKLDGFWFAVKDGAVPALFGLAFIGSLRTSTPLIRTFLYNDQFIDTGRVGSAIAARGVSEAFERLMVRATWMLAGTFFFSAALNFVLARLILKSPGGTPEFNAELGKMTVVSHTVLIVPTLAALLGAFWYFLTGVKRLTGLTIDELLREPPKKAPKPAAN